jgi:hypothetical protein
LQTESGDALRAGIKPDELVADAMIEPSPNVADATTFAVIVWLS